MREPNIFNQIVISKEKSWRSLETLPIDLETLPIDMSTLNN